MIFYLLAAWVFGLVVGILCGDRWIDWLGWCFDSGMKTRMCDLEQRVKVLESERLGPTVERHAGLDCGSASVLGSGAEAKASDPDVSGA